MSSYLEYLDGDRPWSTIHSLILEHVGSILERASTGDVLRARLACKHWHSCLTRSIIRLTLYGGAVPLLTGNTPATKSPPLLERPSQKCEQGLQYQHKHQHPVAKPAQPSANTSSPLAMHSQVSQCYDRHVHLLPSFAPTVRHATIRGQSCDLAGLRLLAHSLPSLTSLSLAISATYTSAPPPHLQPMQPAPTSRSSDPAVAAAASGTLGPTAGSSSQTTLPACAACPLVGSDSTLSSATLASAAAVCPESPSPEDGRWPPAPPLLEKLWIQVHDDVPPDVLRHLLLQASTSVTASPLSSPLQLTQQVSTPLDVSIAAAFRTSELGALEAAARGSGTSIHPGGGVEASGTRCPSRRCGLGAVLPLRELGLLPHLSDDICSAAFGALQPVPFIDLSPLLDQRLAGVTRLVVSPMKNHGRQPQQLPQHQHQQQHHGGAIDQAQLGLGAHASTLRLEEVIARLTQLRSLTVLEQVDLYHYYRDCLSALTNLRALHLPKGVYCEGLADVRQLTTLSLLETLELNFTYEWWLYATELSVLSLLTHLRHLKLSLDYDLEVACAMSEEDALIEQNTDEDQDDTDLDELAAWYVPDDVPDLGSISASVIQWQRRGPAAAAPGPAPAPGANSVVGGGGGGGERFETEEDVMRALAAAWGCAGDVARRALRPKKYDPGANDDWRVPLGCLTQLRRLELRLVNGGGRHLAEAVWAARWLAEGQLRPVGGGDDANTTELENGVGASLTLLDAPAAAFLDVPYWYKMAAGVAADATVGTSSEATFMQPSHPHDTPWPRHVFPAPPLVSLHLGSGRDLRLMPGHILCLGLMTHLRSLTLSFMAVAPFGAALPDECSVARPAGESERRGGYARIIKSDTIQNPFLVLRRLRSLRELRIRTKQLWTGADVLPLSGSDDDGSSTTTAASDGSSSEGGDGRAQLVVSALMDDDVVHAWLEGMPLLHTLVLRGLGRLGERALTALGRHSSLRSLELRLKVPPALPSYAAGKRQFTARPPTGPQGKDNGGVLSMPPIGYGTYYRLGKAFTGRGEASSSGCMTPLGSSPPSHGRHMSCHSLPGGADPAFRSDRAVGGKTDGSIPAERTSSLPGVAQEKETTTKSGGSWQEQLLAEGVECGPEMLAAVPYFVRPHHLPPSLTSLDLTNAAFSAEWAHCVGNGHGPQAEAQQPVCGGTTDADSSHFDAVSRPTGSYPRNGTPRPVARLVSLKLTRRPPKHRRLQGSCTIVDAASGAGVSADAPILDPTRLTDWHLVFLTACQPTLASLHLHDTDDGSGAGDAAKLHYRALAHLGRQLSYLESLTLQVGNRLRWRAQEALFCSLPECLRHLNLHAAHVYCEAVAMASRLVHLSSLQVVGYTEPGYVEALSAAVEEVGQRLPACSILLWYRDVGDLPQGNPM
ncbi:hypothetical protein VaNZ11_006763 [Volvox africanus]|uniref:F-box domain-containing protein n=1 Tax=Volvox africanus TaxID=51714 RepID=A0ABQ5S234_9CHLO|nr:hypothetical protein VaNZ11_006763 [Volvox africanus]